MVLVVMLREVIMLRWLTPLLAALLAIGVQSSVLAADSYPKSWSGLYVGLYGGYGWGDTSIRDGGTPITNPPFGAFSCGPALTGNYCATPFELGPSGWLGGAQLGANWQRGSLVVGAEGDLGWLHILESKTLIRPFDDRDIATIKYGWYGALAGRLGYSVSQALLYVKGGVAFADIEKRAADMDFVNGNFQIYQGSLIHHGQVQTGWALGGGFEHALGRQLSLKVEYLYMNFGSDASRSLDGDIYKSVNDLHTVKVGLNYHFSANSVPPLK
jgi:outer membrane immunogenic protein